MVGQKAPVGRPERSRWRRVPRIWRVAELGLVGLLIVAVAVLELWKHPPGWLRIPRGLVVTALHWLREHWLTSPGLGVIAGFAGVAATLLVFWWQRRGEAQRARQDRAQRSAQAKAQQARLLRAHCRVDETTGWLPRVREVTDPVALGVHPAVDLSSQTPEKAASNRPHNVPAYVPRDLDSALDQALAPGGFVLLVGDSTAGKSRAAFEAMHRRLADWWLLVPSKPESLRALLDAEIQFRNTVVWLNDLDRYLGSDGLDEPLLRRLRGDGTRRIVVLATMRATEYAVRSPIHDVGQPDHKRAQRRAEQTLLDQVTWRLEVPRRFSDAEQQRARTQGQDDPRIADALRHADRYGLAEYLAAGPKLLQEWHDAWAVGNQPAGAALVAAAVDCRRAGLEEPVPASLLLELAPSYLDPTVGGLLSSDAFESGLAWATRPRYGASALLIRHGDGGYLAFDYLFDSLQRDPNAPAIPDAVWQGVVAAVKPGTATSVAFRADHARPRRLDVAEQAYRKAADAGDVHAMFWVGWLAEGRNELDEAAAWYRKAADADAGDVWAMRQLGSLAEGRNELDEAAAWYRKVASVGDVWAMRRLGSLAEKRERFDVAAAWYRTAADANDVQAMRRLGSLAADGCTSAISVLRTVADAGNLWAMQELRRAAEGGNPSVLEALRAAADAGALWAMEMLGRLAKRRGDQQEAEAWFRKAAEVGDPTAIRELGRFAEERGDPEQAVAWYRKITGDPEATEALGRLAEVGNVSALGVLRGAADTGDPEATEMLQRLAEREKPSRKDRTERD